MTSDRARESVPVEQRHRDVAEIAFDDVLGDASSYAEYMRPSYREGAVRTLAAAFARFDHDRTALVRSVLLNLSAPKNWDRTWSHAMETADAAILAALSRPLVRGEVVLKEIDLAISELDAVTAAPGSENALGCAELALQRARAALEGQPS